MATGIKVAFTGHRPDKLGGYDGSPLQDRIRIVLKSLLAPLQPDVVISGMALGVDTIAADVAIELGIPLIAAVPFEGQEGMWPVHSQQKYKNLLAKASEIVYCSEPGYAKWKMYHRNKWMVDHCTVLIAVWDGSEGGTKNCVDYAKKIGRSLLTIDPRTV